MGFRPLLATALVGAVVAVMLLRSDGSEIRSGKAPGQRLGSESSPAAPAAAPKRIFPGSAAAVDWLVALEIDPSRIVALPEQVERWSNIRLAPEAWSDHPRYTRLTSEIALGYEPDLVLVSPFSDASTIARIGQGQGRVISVEDPGSWDTFLGIVDDLAGAAGAPQNGAALKASMEARRRALAARPVKKLRVLPYGNFGGGGSTSGTGTTLDLAIGLAGFVNVAAEAGMKGSAELGFEQILALQFDAFLIPGTSGQESSSGRALLDARALEGIEAVKNQRFLTLSDALFASSSITILDAAESIAKQGDGLLD